MSNVFKEAVSKDFKEGYRIAMAHVQQLLQTYSFEVSGLKDKNAKQDEDDYNPMVEASANGRLSILDRIDNAVTYLLGEIEEADNEED